MGTLFVIGNGFDLHFGLKTKTADFEDFLSEQRIEGEMDNALEILNTYGVDWSEYEQSLADMNLDIIEQENLSFPDYMSDRESDRVGIQNVSYIPCVMNISVAKLSTKRWYILIVWIMKELFL